jgi:putative hemolysin
LRDRRERPRDRAQANRKKEGITVETIWLEMILIVMAILANGFFAGSELALVSARQGRLTRLRDESVRGAATALALKRDPETFLATIQIAITLVGTLASAVGGATAIEALTPWLAELPMPGARQWAEPVALAVVILTITYVSLVLGELVPKSLALRDPERVACRVARPIQALVRAAAWPGRGLTRSTRAVLTLLGQREAPAAPLVSEEEVKYLVREGVSHGVFEHQESELVHRVFQFTDTPVRAVMVPRPKILALDLDTPPGDVLTRVAAHGRTRFPVVRGSLDDTVGVVVIKDLLRCAAEGKPPVLAQLLHPPLFVPESARTSEVLRAFQQQHRNLAMVVDEYGRTVGLVTVEDLLEEIVGELREERESRGLPYVTRLPDGAYLIDGAASIHDLRLQAGLPLEDSAEYHTIAGFLLHALNTVPQPGVSVAAHGFVWTVVDMDGPRIAKVKAERKTA